MRSSFCFALFLLAVAPGLCWNGHQTQSGPLKLLIEEVPTVTALDQPVPVRVRLENSGNTPLSGTAEVRDLVDATRVVGEAKRSFRLAAGGSAALEFAVAFGKGTYSALYPVHVYVEFTQDGRALSAHAVRIVTTQIDEAATAARPFAAIPVPSRGALPLWSLRAYRVAWQYDGSAPEYESVGWTGSDARSRANMTVVRMTRGATRDAIGLHPPYLPRTGTIFCDYLLKLPAAKPLRLTFANAIRDSSPTEPRSDGVRFRVWASENPSGVGARLLYERFTDTKSWLPGEASLDAYAGKTILLRLESDPGPARSTTCDSSYWAEPTLAVGLAPKPEGPAFAALAARSESAAKQILKGRLKPNNRTSFLLGRGKTRIAALAAPTPHGIVDGVLSFVGPASAVHFHGLSIDILGQPVLRGLSAIGFRSCTVKAANGSVVYSYQLERDGQRFPLTVTLRAEAEALRVAFACPERITRFALGAADREAPVVYYGHGYRIVRPKAFRVGFGGHNLATSHVGFDFAGGVSLLQATNTPPDFLEVNPETREYALQSHMDGTLTLLPGLKGALDCALRYRPLYDKRPAGGVARLAGRYCFDIWGGRYADIAARMQQMVRYGLTDSILTIHNWQRWGYDYRLPDIWPPNPDLGSVEDLRQVSDLCRAHDIPWGLHDNYIDFYPDASGYSYDDLCFTADGKPIKAWLNQGREAQSYRWRPDRILPFVQRNLKPVKDGVAPTHSFLDVFTSTSLFDFYDREGRFHPSTETRRCWGEVFATIRNTLGGNAPTTSEAGDDGLIGYLDGADCQFMMLSADHRRYANYLPCEKWERVPWFDAVNHQRFILHGVGYSGRYEAGRDRHDHGINSDDYLSAEILTGHALMTDAQSWGRQAVRKYWLAQDVARSLSLKEITDWKSAGGDAERQTVTWSTGAKVYVNRSASDWSVAGRTLPQYGYLVQGPSILSAVEKRDGRFCEESVGPGGWYCSARAFDPDRRLRLRPRVEGFRDLGDGRIQWNVVWDAGEPTPKAGSVFVHFYSDRATRRDKIAFQDDHRPDTSTDTWKGTIRYSRTITIPADAQGEYKVAFGILSAGGRLPLCGPQAGVSGGNAVWVGTLAVTRRDGKIAGISFTPPPEEMMREESAHYNQDGGPVDFGFALTDGAFRVQKTASGLRLTPLPDSPAFAATLRLGAFGAPGKRVKGITARGSAGEERAGLFTQEGDTVSLKHDGQAFCYDIVLAAK